MILSNNLPVYKTLFLLLCLCLLRFIYDLLIACRINTPHLKMNLVECLA